MSGSVGTGSELVIGVLLPDVLGTYADAGNAVVLAQRARWRAIPARVLEITAGTPPPSGCDIYLLGGSEDSAQVFAAQWLARHPALRHAMGSSAVTLAICAGLQILGHTMTDRSGHSYPGLGLLDLTTVPARRRAVGEVVTRCTIPGVGELTGFENHQGVTTLGDGVSPLGDVRRGVGNGSGAGRRRRGDGVSTDRIIGTYLHGPVLARNPALADHILHRVTGRHLTPLELPGQQALRESYLGPGGHPGA